MPKGSRRQAPVVAITGASGGVGRAVARAFARRGARLGLIARGMDGLRATRAEAVGLGAEALALPADVADADAVAAAADRLAARFGGVDVWINNAMTTVFAPLSAMTAAEFRRATEVTYLGCVHGTLAALHHMRPRGRGAIVQVGSALAYRGIPLQAAYCGAKFAIRGFTDSLRCELLHEGSGIRVSMVQLPAVNTPQFLWCRTHLPRKPRPVPPVCRPEAAARAVLYAADHAPRELWVGRATLKTIAGALAAPAFMDRYLAERAYDGQMTDGAPEPGRPDNLFAPADGDFGAHGPFDGAAEPSAAIMTAGRARQAALAGGLGLAAAAVGLGVVGGRGLARRSRR